MSRSIRQKGLNRLYEDDDPRDVIAEPAVKLGDILARFDAARTAADMNLPRFRLHALKGRVKRFLGGDSSRKLAGDFPLCGERGTGRRLC